MGLSPGEQILDMVHVDDAASAFLVAARRLLAAPAPLMESFLVSGERMTVRQLVARMAGAGLPVQAQWGARPYRPREVMVPCDPGGHRLPGWAPAVSLERGLREAFEAMP